MPDQPNPFEVILDQGSPVTPPPLFEGDHAPWFTMRSDINPTFKFSSLGGRRLVLSFLPSLDAPLAQALMRGAKRFGDGNTALLLVTFSSDDAHAHVPDGVHGVRYLFDPDRALAALFVGVGAALMASPVTYVIDQRLRIRRVVREPEAAAHAAAAYRTFDALTPTAALAAAGVHAPVLIVPYILEPDICQTLIAGFEASGGEESGFMVERNGMTVVHVDHSYKRRSDWQIADTELVRACHTRLLRRLCPEIARVFQFNATRIERNTVARYESSGGYFRPHRDNTTRGTAHRRFAVSINLNAEDYEGGDLVFPEFGRQRFRPPTGGACVFSCSLLHEATPVTRGVRYVYVPFLYDDAGAEQRRENLQYLADGQRTPRAYSS